MRPEPPFVPGAECAGVIKEVGAGSRFAPGDRVAAFPVLGALPRRSPCPKRWSSRCPTGCRSRSVRPCR
jgi:NADPH2:quinone reductase